MILRDIVDRGRGHALRRSVVGEGAALVFAHPAVLRSKPQIPYFVFEYGLNIVVCKALSCSEVGESPAVEETHASISSEPQISELVLESRHDRVVYEAL